MHLHLISFPCSLVPYWCTHRHCCFYCFVISLYCFIRAFQYNVYQLCSGARQCACGCIYSSPNKTCPRDLCATAEVDSTAAAYYSTSGFQKLNERTEANHLELASKWIQGGSKFRSEQPLIHSDVNPLFFASIFAISSPLPLLPPPRPPPPPVSHCWWRRGGMALIIMTEHTKPYGSWSSQLCGTLAVLVLFNYSCLCKAGNVEELSLWHLCCGLGTSSGTGGGDDSGGGRNSRKR